MQFEKPESPRNDIDVSAADSDAEFRATRLAALAQINVTTYWLTALLVMLFSAWDWFVDPANWAKALAIRSVGSVVILATGIVQRVSGRVDWAAHLARIRYGAAVLAVAGALAVLERGYLVGLAGLIAVMMSGAYIALDRRDLLPLNAVPVVAVGLVMYAAGLDRFAVVNATTFIALSLAVSMLLARVFEDSNRRAFTLERQLMREARTDALTGLLNRRALEEIAGLELKRSARAGAPLSVILCDVDHFKSINDRHGHAAGDRAIRSIGERLQTVLRETDAFGRWGGEEFLAILPGTAEDAASHLAERMRQAIESAPIDAATGLCATISLGVAGGGRADKWDALVKAADEALYRAKAEGRNRSVVAAHSPGAGLA